MKTKVKLGMHQMSVTELLGFATQVVSKMTGNSFFPSPIPTLDAVNGAVVALQNSYNKAQGGGPEQTAAMHQSKDLLQDMLTALGHYVENVANTPANAEGGETVVLSAGMYTRRFTPTQRQIFTVKNGKLPGTAELLASGLKRGSHEWQYAADPPTNGWTDAEPTVQAATVIVGLEPGKRYSFRHRAILTDGPAAWEDPQSIIII